MNEYSVKVKGKTRWIPSSSFLSFTLQEKREGTKTGALQCILNYLNYLILMYQILYTCFKLYDRYIFFRANYINLYANNIIFAGD